MRVIHLKWHICFLQIKKTVMAYTRKNLTIYSNAFEYG